ncbi:hypothetical protein FRX31_002570 [Thalictrum thalictroides]|uniref:Uncharacterized protein n=1 Tax=Thalictrum thalictroides TaxID=46969 RepID=A0A7J6XE56_THATH|nr:hypothetical protein FRX31_002570 [Thalictrum thalictroides]
MEKKNIMIHQKITNRMSEAEVDEEKFDPQEIKSETTPKGSSEKPVAEELVVSASPSPCAQTMKIEPELSLSGSKRKISAEATLPLVCKESKMTSKQYFRRCGKLQNKKQEEHAHIEEVADITEQYEKELDGKKLISDQSTSRLEEELASHQAHELEGQHKLIEKQYDEERQSDKVLYDEYKLQLEKKEQENAPIQDIAHIGEQYEKKLDAEKLFALQSPSRFEGELLRKQSEIEEASQEIMQDTEKIADQAQEIERLMLNLQEEMMKKELAEKNEQCKIFEKRYSEECQSHKVLYDEYEKLQREKKEEVDAHIEEIASVREQYEKKLEGEKLFSSQSTSRLEEELLSKQSELEEASEEIKQKTEIIANQAQEFERLMVHLEEMKKELEEKNKECKVIENQHDEECQRHKVLYDEYTKLQLEKKEQKDAHIEEIASLSKQYEKKLDGEKLFALQSTSRLEEELLSKQSELEEVSEEIKQKDEKIADQARELERLMLNKEEMEKELAEKNEQCKIFAEQRDEECRRHKLLYDEYNKLQLEKKEQGDAHIQEVARLRELHDKKLEDEKLFAVQSTSRFEEDLSIKKIELETAFKKISQQTEQIANLVNELDGQKNAHIAEIVCLSEQYEKKLDSQKLYVVQSTNRLAQEVSSKNSELEQAFQKMKQQAEIIARQAHELEGQTLNQEELKKKLAEKDEQYKIIKKDHEEESSMFKVLFDEYNQLHLEKKIQEDAHCQEVSRLKEQYGKKLDEEKLLAAQFTTRLEEELSSKKSELEEAFRNINHQAEKIANQAHELEGLILIKKQMEKELAEKNEQFKMIVMQCEEKGQRYNVLCNEYNQLKLDKKEQEEAHVKDVARLNEQCEKRLEEELASKKTELEETCKIVNQHAERIANQADGFKGLLLYQDKMKKDLQAEKNLQFKMIKKQYDEECRRKYNQLHLEKKEEIARLIDHYDKKLHNEKLLAARSSVRCTLLILGVSSEMYQTRYKALIQEIKNRLGLDWPSDFSLSNEVSAILPFLNMESEVGSIHEGERKEQLLAEPGRSSKGVEIQVAPAELSTCSSFQTTPGVEVPYSDLANFSVTRMQPVRSTSTMKPVSRYGIVRDYMARLQHQIESRQNEDQVLLAIPPTTASTMMKRRCFHSSILC